MWNSALSNSMWFFSFCGAGQGFKGVGLLEAAAQGGAAGGARAGRVHSPGRPQLAHAHAAAS